MLYTNFEMVYDKTRRMTAWTHAPSDWEANEYRCIVILVYFNVDFVTEINVDSLPRSRV